MSLKIQINTLEALERLIGGDNQIEFDIRQNIVEVFATKHLKAVANMELIGKATGDIHEMVQDSVSTNTVKEAIESYLKTRAVVVKIDHLLNKQCDFIVNELSEAMLTKKIDLLVDKRIKERLGISL